MRIALAAFFTLHYLSAALAFGLPLVIAWQGRAARGLISIALVNLSVAVVLGVAVLLFITMAWPGAFVASVVHFFWPLMGVVPLLSLAFASLYAYRLVDWRPGPWVAAVAVLGVATVFAAIAADPMRPVWALRMLHFLAAAITAAGAMAAIRCEGTWGARVAFVGSLVQGIAGTLYLISLSHRGPAFGALAALPLAWGWAARSGSGRARVCAVAALLIEVAVLVAVRESAR